jgi:hypothetical protein
MTYEYHIYLIFHPPHGVLDILSIISSALIKYSYIEKSSKFYE